MCMNEFNIDYIDAVDGLEANRLAIEKLSKIKRDNSDGLDFEFIQQVILNMNKQNQKHNRIIRERFPLVI